jgi:hypothetical protein
VHPQDGLTVRSFNGASPVFLTVKIAGTLVVVPSIMSPLLISVESNSTLGPAEIQKVAKRRETELIWMNFSIYASSLW